MQQLITEKLNIPRHYLGFYYLRTAIHAKLYRPSITSQELLEVVAKVYGKTGYKTTAKKVQGCINRALAYIGYKGGMNQFIAKVEQEIRKEMVA